MKKGMLDLATIDTIANEGAELAVLHPKTGIALGAKITVCGTDSEIYQDTARKQRNKRLDRLQKTRGKAGITAEATDAEEMDLLVACTLSWADVVLDGKDLDCTPDNARALYTRFPCIKEQVDEFIGDRANFIKG